MRTQNELSTSASLPLLAYKEQAVVYAGIVFIAALSWWYLVWYAYEMQADMGLQGDMNLWMPPSAHNSAWGAFDFMMLFLMWAVMMLAMMLPTVFPLARVYASFYKQRHPGNSRLWMSNVLILGYAFAWTIFSAVITLAEWPLHISGVLNPMMEPLSLLFSGIAILLAGIYQWTPMKTSCLVRCRSPIGFLFQYWTETVPSVFLLGARYGLICIGCCWALMILLLGLGMMNILWVAALTLLMLAEKVLPHRTLMQNTFGIVFSVWGLYLIATYFNLL